MPEPQKRGPKLTGRRRVVRYWTDEEIAAADDVIAFIRKHPAVVREIIDDGPIRLEPDEDGILRAIRSDGALKEDSENM